MHVQKELPLFPLPRWPTWAYLRGALVIYLVASLLAAGAFFVVVVAVAQPLHERVLSLVAYRAP